MEVEVVEVVVWNIASLGVLNKEQGGSVLMRRMIIFITLRRNKKWSRWSDEFRFNSFLHQLEITTLLTAPSALQPADTCHLPPWHGWRDKDDSQNTQNSEHHHFIISHWLVAFQFWGWMWIPILLWGLAVVFAMIKINISFLLFQNVFFNDFPFLKNIFRYLI